MIAPATARTRVLPVLAGVAVLAAATAHAERHDRRARELTAASPYIVATFKARGTAYVHVDELRTAPRAGAGDRERSLGVVKHLIRDAARRASSPMSDAPDGDIVLTGLWAFDVPQNAAVEARSHACRLEAQGHRPWIASACGPLRATAPRDVRADVSARATDEPRAPGTAGSATDASLTRPAGGTDAAPTSAPARTPGRRGRTPIVDLGALWRAILPFLPLVVLLLFFGRLRRGLSGIFRLPFRVAHRLAPRALSSDRRRRRSVADADGARDPVAEKRARQLPHLPLRQIVRSDVLLERLARLGLDGASSEPGRAVSVSWVARHGEAFRRAATETSLSPELVATVVLAEQRRVPSAMPVGTALTTEVGRLARGLHAAINGTEALDDARLLVFASELVARGTAHALGFFEEYVGAQAPVSALRDIVADTAASQLPDELALGLGQRDVASLVDLGIHRDARLATEWKLDGLADRALRRELRRRLLDEPDNVRLCAKVVRRLADMAADLTRRRPDLARKALDVAAVPPADVEANRLLTFVRDSCAGVLDLARFAQHPDDWTPAHVSFIAWRYHARHLGATDTVHGEPGWTAAYLGAFADIARSRIFR